MRYRTADEGDLEECVWIDLEPPRFQWGWPTLGVLLSTVPLTALLTIPSDEMFYNAVCCALGGTGLVGNSFFLFYYYNRWKKAKEEYALKLEYILGYR